MDRRIKNELRTMKRHVGKPEYTKEAMEPMTLLEEQSLTYDPYHVMDRHLLIKEVLAKKLRPRLARIVCLYFGLDDGQELTLNEIGYGMGISRARVKQLLDEAIRQLKHPSLAKYLDKYNDFDT